MSESEGESAGINATSLLRKGHVSSVLCNKIGVMNHALCWKLEGHVISLRLCYMIITLSRESVARVTCVASTRYPCSETPSHVTLRSVEPGKYPGSLSDSKHSYQSVFSHSERNKTPRDTPLFT